MSARRPFANCADTGSRFHRRSARAGHRLHSPCAAAECRRASERPALLPAPPPGAAAAVAAGAPRCPPQWAARSSSSSSGNSSTSDATTTTATTGAVAAVAKPAAGQLGVLEEAVGTSGLALASAEANSEVVQWVMQNYSRQRRTVVPRARRALAALQALSGGDTALTLERDILPKVELLEALSPGLGVKVFMRYPEEFAHPDAVEYWSILAAQMFTVGLSPATISMLLARNISLLSRTVRNPANVRRLFEWLKREVGLEEADVHKVVRRFPLALQTDVDAVLRPRVAYMQELGLPLARVAIAIKRHPELLGVDVASLQERADFLEGLGLDKLEVARLFGSDPHVLLYKLSKLQGVVDCLVNELCCPAPLLHKLLLRSGLFHRSLPTLRARAEYWQHKLGLGPEQLLHMLDRCPRLLSYPMDQPKYVQKLHFLTDYIGLPVSAVAAFPQYVTYSLERIAPRAAAARRLPVSQLPLSKLAFTDAGFARWCGMEGGEEELARFSKEWWESEEAQPWAPVT